MQLFMQIKQLRYRVIVNCYTYNYVDDYLDGRVMFPCKDLEYLDLEEKEKNNIHASPRDIIFETRPLIPHKMPTGLRRTKGKERERERH